MRKILIIGGTDSSGGAGLTRDADVARALGFEVAPVVTAVTAQSDARVYGVQLMPVDFVKMQIEAALAAHDPVAIKIGMLGTREIAEAVAGALTGSARPVVIDPVLKSSSGGALMAAGVPRQLMSQATLITPNLPEAAALTGQPVARTHDQLAAQARWLMAEGAGAVLIKGGHAEGARATDHLFTEAKRTDLHALRLGAAMRGTGCAMATAIACHCGDGQDLAVACENAKQLVYRLLCERANR